jgi:hypothetical protein
MECCEPSRADLLACSVHSPTLMMQLGELRSTSEWDTTKPLREVRVRLDQQCQKLMGALASTSAWPQPQWEAFRESLRACLEIERRCLLSWFSRVNPLEAASIEREHAELLECLDGIGQAPSSAGIQAMNEFRKKLLANTRREQALLYPWVEGNLDQAQVGLVSTRLAAALDG